MNKYKATGSVEKLTLFSKHAEGCLFLCEVNMDWNDKEQLKEYYRKYREENRSKFSGYNKKWRDKYLETNREKYVATKKKWYEAHKHQVSLYKKEWRKKRDVTVDGQKKLT